MKQSNKAKFDNKFLQKFFGKDLFEMNKTKLKHEERLKSAFDFDMALFIA